MDSLRNQFIVKINNLYSINEVVLEQTNTNYNYVWAMYREYNLYNINPKILKYKGAFGNLGFKIYTNHLLLKEELSISDQDILFDIAKLDKLNSLNQIIYNQLYNKYINLLISESQLDHKLLSDKLKYVIKEYFSCNYVNYSKKHFDLLCNYLNTIIDLDSKCLLLITNLKGEKKIFSILKKTDIGNAKLSVEDIVTFPFSKPYTDVVSRKTIILDP